MRSSLKLWQRWPSAGSVRAKHLLLLGETGAGKSLLACTLLDSKAFQVGDGLESCTSSIKTETGKLFGEGEGISVTDTGGLGDTKGRDSEFVDAVAKHVREQGGVHGVVYVHNACSTRLQKSAQESLLTMAHTLADESSHPALCERLGIVLTQCPHRRPIYERQLPGMLKKLLKVSGAPRMFWPTDPARSTFRAMLDYLSRADGWNGEFAAWVARLPSEPFVIPDESTRDRLKREFEENRRREQEVVKKMKQETVEAKRRFEEAQRKVDEEQAARKEAERQRDEEKQAKEEAEKQKPAKEEAEKQHNQEKPAKEEAEKLRDEAQRRLEEQERRQREYQPRYTPSSGGGGSSCFPPKAIASLAVGVEREVGALVPGDTLSLPLWPGQSGQSTTVYLQDSHAGVAGQAARPTTYLQIQHKLQPPHRPLLVTANHFVFTVQAGSTAHGYERGVLPAGMLRVGVDALLVVNKSTQVVEASEVQSIVEVELAGYASPLAAAGELVVEGVLVSSYALGSQQPLQLWQAAPAVLRRRAQSIFHALAFPLRFRHHIWSMLSGRNPPALALQSSLSFVSVLLDIA